MSVTNNINQIDAAAASYAPAVLNGVIAVEQAAAGLPGQTKTDIVVNTIVTGAQAAAKVAENVPVPTVAGVGALVDVVVSILNAAGIFTHSSAAPAAPQNAAPAAASAAAQG